MNAMRNKYALKLAAAAVVLLSVASMSTTTWAAGLLEEGKLKAGSDLIYPPYNYLEDSVAKGFDADILALIAPKMNVEVEFLDTRFASLIPGLRAKKYDMIASALYVTAERAKVIDYVPYALSGASLVVRSDSQAAPKVPEDLCGSRVGSQQGAAWIPAMKALSEEKCGGNAIIIQEFGTSAEAGQALFSNGVDVQIVDAGVGKAAVDASNGRLKVSSETMLYPIVIGFGVAKGNTELAKAIESGLADIKASGEYQELLTQYNLAEPNEAEIKDSLGIE
ncbi:polar amino acid transport system substrate-binding protein [Mycoplana sp. BE70]|uniref:transporter substrate-binding domain-containing protein n=1 Tax=Mycoplana sp. BE70 TaxID=2817775 RepID=UPI0028544A5C|nr:transporter substrate-binding domain-containing protein [Mycoplana sp. BE70]MDR6759171.1 polar amino acid transport system substrate-binding protein [Mycoplana sp. BE70]